MKAVLKAFAGKGILLPNKLMATIAAIMFFTITLLFSSCGKSAPTPIVAPPTAGEVNAKLIANTGSSYWAEKSAWYSTSGTKMDAPYTLGGAEKNYQLTYAADGNFTFSNVGGGESLFLYSGTWKFSDDGKKITQKIVKIADGVEVPDNPDITITAISATSFTSVENGTWYTYSTDVNGNDTVTGTYSFRIVNYAKVTK
jgi:hypothetical protein